MKYLILIIAGALVLVGCGRKDERLVLNLTDNLPDNQQVLYLTDNVCGNINYRLAVDKKADLPLDDPECSGRVVNNENTVGLYYNNMWHFPFGGSNSLTKRIETLEAQNQRIVDYLGVVDYTNKRQLIGVTVECENGTVIKEDSNDTNWPYPYKAFCAETILTKDKNKVEWVKLGCEEKVCMGRTDTAQMITGKCSSEFYRCQELKELINL